MKSIATIAALTLAATLLAPAASTPLQAQGRSQDAPGRSKAPQIGGITMPVTGTDSVAQFAGTFTLNRFVATDNGVAAVGIVSGTLVDALGTMTTVVRTVAIPVTIGQPAPAAAPSAAAIGVQAICDILHLELGPLDLDLLGLVVHLDRIVLDIDAESGPGNLLGNLLCAVVGLLDNPTGLAQLLNDILAIIS
jgi:hypothetical protein